LGADYEIWGFNDGKLEDTSETRASAVRVYNWFKPSLVIGLHGLDVHPDHRANSSIALGPAMQRGVNIEYFTCELCSSGRHTDGDRPQSLGFMPTHYVDTTQWVEQVDNMTRCHASQDPEAMIVGMARVHANRAAESGLDQCTQAEAFVRLTRVGDLHPEIEKIFNPSPFNLPRRIGCDFKPENIGIEA
jgi:LmbE family N-acetylglucosaminyl deacetylase